jgi:hypothetical protein
MRRIVGRLGQCIIIALITLVLLELVTRIVWWHRPYVTLFHKKVALLPHPLITERQIEVLNKMSGKSDYYIKFDPALGWTIQPNASAEYGGVSYHSNSIGIRSQKEYALIKPQQVVRLAAFGPSFTFGWDVSDAFVWTAIIEQTARDVELMNWGVGGYGTDQAYLRYLAEGAKYQPDIVTIGYEEDTLFRNVSRYRPFLQSDSAIPVTKPVYWMENGKLRLLENPYKSYEALHSTLLGSSQRFLDDVCSTDYFCQQAVYQPHSLDIFSSYRILRTLAYEIQLRRNSEQGVNPGIDPRANSELLLQMFVNDVRRNHSLPVLILCPQSAATLAHYEKGVPPGYQHVVPTMAKMGVKMIDLAKVFVAAQQASQQPFEAFFAPGGHYSELGNQIVADAVLQLLQTEGVIQQMEHLPRKDNSPPARKII